MPLRDGEESPSFSGEFSLDFDIQVEEDRGGPLPRPTKRPQTDIRVWQAFWEDIAREQQRLAALARAEEEAVLALLLAA